MLRAMARGFALDEQSLTRRGWFGDTRVPWDEIRDYRLAIDLMPRVEPGFQILPGPPTAGSRESTFALISTIVHALRDKDDAEWRRVGRVTVWLRTERVALSLRRTGLDIALISEIVSRVHQRLAAAARKTLDATGTVQFGPLALTSHTIQWKHKPSIARKQVEAIELFDTSAVRFRVMKLDKVWPYGASPLRAVPNPLVALELARWLDYPVRGLEMLDWVLYANPSLP